MSKHVETALFVALQVRHPCGKTDADLAHTDDPRQLSCAGCTTPVNNLSAMTFREVAAMQQEPGGHCVRYATDSQGRIQLAPSKRAGAQRWLAPAALSLAATAAACDSRQAESPTAQVEAVAAPRAVRLPHVEGENKQGLQLPTSATEAESSPKYLDAGAALKALEGDYCNGVYYDETRDRPSTRKRRDRKVRVETVDLPGAGTGNQQPTEPAVGKQ